MIYVNVRVDVIVLINYSTNSSFALSQMLDVSSDLGLIRIGLYQALEEIELDSDGSLTTPTDLSWQDSSIQEELNCKELEYNLLELLMNRRYVKALRLTRQYRYSLLDSIISYLNIFENTRAGWPSGQRCELASVRTRVRFQP